MSTPPLAAGGPLSTAGDVTATGRLHLRKPQHSDVTDVQQALVALTSLADAARRRLDQLEDRLTRLTAFIGAAETLTSTSCSAGTSWSPPRHRPLLHSEPLMRVYPARLRRTPTRSAAAHVANRDHYTRPLR